MIMSLLVPVITNKLRHFPAHLVEKNAWNDVRHEASKVTIVQCLILYGWALNTVQQWPTAMQSPCIFMRSSPDYSHHKINHKPVTEMISEIKIY